MRLWFVVVVAAALQFVAVILEWECAIVCACVRVCGSLNESGNNKFPTEL